MRNALQRIAPVALLAASLLATGCAHHTNTAAYQPPPPAPTYVPHTASVTPNEERKEAPAGFFDDVSGKPVFTETGYATWYTAAKGRNAADGHPFIPEAMTAAHKTLPLGSTARITNLTTGQQILVRITDRGPFVPGRVLDLSPGAAKAVGIYRVGMAKVRVEGFAHPGASSAGKWVVQTGSFKTEQDAIDLKTALLKRYQGSRVIEFPSSTGYWVRIDPVGHDFATAEKIFNWIGAPDKYSQAYIVRID